MKVSIVRDNSVPSRFNINNVRIAYAQGLNTPSVVAQGAPAPGQVPAPPKYSAVFLFPEAETEVLKQLQGIMWEAVQKAFGQQAEGAWKEMTAGNKLCLRSGATKATQEGFEGNYFITASAKESAPPMLFHKYANAQGTAPEILPRPQSVIYSGCYVNAQLDLWVQNNSSGRRVNASLLAVQFADDGESFGGGATANPSMFAAAPRAEAAAPPAAGFSF